MTPVQYSLMVGLCITYSVTAGQSMKVRAAFHPTACALCVSSQSRLCGAVRCGAVRWSPRVARAGRWPLGRPARNPRGSAHAPAPGRVVPQGMVGGGCHGGDCLQGLAPWILAFGALQLALSQVPDFSSLW